MEIKKINTSYHWLANYLCYAIFLSKIYFIRIFVQTNCLFKRFNDFYGTTASVWIYSQIVLGQYWRLPYKKNCLMFNTCFFLYACFVWVVRPRLRSSAEEKDLRRKETNVSVARVQSHALRCLRVNQCDAFHTVCL